MFGLLKKSLSSLSEKLGLAKKQEPEQQKEETVKQEVTVGVQESRSISKKSRIKESEPITIQKPEEIKELEKELKQEKKVLSKPVAKKKEIKLEIPKEQEKKEETAVSVFTKLKSLFSEKYKLADSEITEILDNFELSLLQSDVSLKVCEILKKEFAQKLKDGVPKKDLPAFLKQLFLEIIFANYPEPVEQNFFDAEKKPFVIMFVGTNGGGKTTSIAKLAHYLQSKEKSVVLSASDTYRAAAMDQLEGHANKLQLQIIKGKYGQDPASVAFDAVAFAKTKGIDFVLVDTSGRQDNALNLMKELEKIKRVINPDFVVFVAEAIAGQTALQQAESFNKMTNFNAFVLTKTDVDEKGGTLLSISLGLQKPVLFLGTGQEYKDLAFFDKKFLEGVI